MDLKELYWLAGILEGEASFSTSDNTPKIALAMTDKDVVEKVAAMFGAKVRVKQPRFEHHKVQYCTGLCGSKAAGFLMTLWSLMGERRKAKISEVLKGWLAQPCRGSRKPYCPYGHPRTEENLYETQNGWMSCRQCREIHTVKSNEKIKEQRAAKTHCRLGHEYSVENTIIRTDGKRRCRICMHAAGVRSHETRRLNAIKNNDERVA